jgi:hypothetical protein
MEATWSSKTSVDFQLNTWLYIPEDIILHNKLSFTEHVALGRLLQVSDTLQKVEEFKAEVTAAQEVR